jgi:uncharacterized protein (DUF2267 family)
MQNTPHLFGETVGQTHTWLRQINDEMGGWMPDDYALQALRAGLHALRDQLTVDQAAHLSAQLPILVRGIYFEQWVPSQTPARDRHEDVFLSRIQPYFAGKDRVVDSKAVVRAVFKVLHRHISEGESEKLYNALPKDIRRYWPAQRVFGEIETEMPSATNLP